ncbi:hypothetical protein [Streptomyces sp. NPDC004546]|uniref:hypothetical protein n=1 Tax=Streptomyces sp. NPDC004546 TaxID=3154282 RepID=UPI0033AC3CB4
MSDLQPAWQEWLNSLDVPRKAAAEPVARCDRRLNRAGLVRSTAPPQRLLAAGADREDLVRLVRAVAYEAVFATLDELDAGGDVNVSGVNAGWVVMESGEDGSPTGRALADLHEDLLTMDPSGRDGADLWQ